MWFKFKRIYQIIILCFKFYFFDLNIFIKEVYYFLQEVAWEDIFLNIWGSFVVIPSSLGYFLSYVYYIYQKCKNRNKQRINFENNSEGLDLQIMLLRTLDKFINTSEIKDDGEI